MHPNYHIGIPVELKQQEVSENGISTATMCPHWSCSREHKINANSWKELDRSTSGNGTPGRLEQMLGQSHFVQLVGGLIAA